MLPQNITVGDQKMPPQNMPLWHRDYSERIILRNRRSSGNRVETCLLQGNLTYTKEIPLVGVRLCTRTEGLHSSRDSYHGQDTGINRQNEPSPCARYSSWPLPVNTSLHTLLRWHVSPNLSHLSEFTQPRGPQVYKRSTY